jgi:hypothetical protein
MASMASIDIPAMGKLISAMTDAAGNLPYDKYGLTSALSPVDVDSSPAGKLSAVASWVEQQIPGLRRRLALAQSIEAQQPGFQNVVKIDESTISTMDPTAAQNLGAADAKKLKDSHGAVDPKLIAEIAKYKDDPYFAAGLATNITPTELSQVVTNESGQYRTLTQYGGGDPDYLNKLNSWKKQYGDLLSALGGTLATATRNTGDLALPSDYAKSWSDTITAEGPSDGGRAPYGQGAALSLLLRYGSYGTSFLHTVSDDVYNYEREHGKDGPVWKPRSFVSDGTFEGVYDPTGQQISDPLAGIMTALSHNPDAAQQFFDVGNPNASTTDVEINGQKVPVNARLKYLIEDRTWATGMGSDNGAGLGGALQAASTFYRDNSSQGQISATIAAQTFALIGSYTGHGHSDGGLFGIGSHQGWKMWDGMRTPVANMVASYAPDLIRTTGTDHPPNVEWDGQWVVSDAANSLFPPNGPASAWMDPRLMSNLIGTLGEDQKNMDVVNAGLAASGRIMLNYAAQQGLKIDPDTAAKIISGKATVPGFSGAAGSLAYALNFAINAGYHGDDSNEEFQKQRAENISKILGIVTSVPALELPEGHAWTGFLIDQIKDQALDKIGEGPDQDAQSTYNDTSADYQTQLRHLTLNSLLANGYFSNGNYEKANGDGPKIFVSPFDPKYADQDPPAVTRSADGTLQFNFDSQAYKDWSQAGQAVNGWMEANVVGPFRENLPAYGE